MASPTIEQDSLHRGRKVQNHRETRKTGKTTFAPKQTSSIIMSKPPIRVKICSSSEGNVKNPSIKFAGGLLKEAGISPHPNQKLNIKLEIDTNPPSGFSTETSLINEYFPVALIHHDKSSFIAGKCHAILQREWTKGRDFFDLLFYLNRWEGIEPNYGYLNKALIQTGYKGAKITEKNWRTLLLEKVNEVSWPAVEEDVKPFLLNVEDLKIFSKEFLVEELGR